MSKQEVFNLLKKHPTKWFTIKEIVPHMDCGHASVTANVRRLHQSNQIIKDRKRVDCNTIPNKKYYHYVNIFRIRPTK